MRYMNWSYSDLMSAPDDLVRVIIDQINEIAERQALESA